MNIFWNRGIRRCQNWLNSDFQNHLATCHKLSWFLKNYLFPFAIFSKPTYFVKMDPFFSTRHFSILRKNSLFLVAFMELIHIFLYSNLNYSTSKVMLVCTAQYVHTFTMPPKNNTNAFSFYLLNTIFLHKQTILYLFCILNNFIIPFLK